MLVYMGLKNTSVQGIGVYCHGAGPAGIGSEGSCVPLRYTNAPTTLHPLPGDRLD